ncbi:hypothetical protein LRM42_00335 [Candidatus Nanosynbacter sp. TM7-075]|uniref:hypothetical protein n=1 Tax=Candidatus Nanosynbacter sp. TM7-075 TaxID=2902633 RepID=UPI001FB6B893|nr:hypothetical protein [Candidatus Nanosynbacter sp. TM7-075]MCJ1966768.1 hypothetical protein [Candidatus Nanosynbacter sp. TM7-075]
MSRKVNKIVKLITGLLIIVPLLCQLFTFEKFSAFITYAGIPSSLSLSIAIILVVVELTSLPFLIDMDMPKRITLTSRMAGFLSLGIMTVISFLTFANGHAAVIFGATIKNVNSVAAIFLVFVMWALLICANLSTKKTAK